MPRFVDGKNNLFKASLLITFLIVLTHYLYAIQTFPLLNAGTNSPIFFACSVCFILELYLFGNPSSFFFRVSKGVLILSLSGNPRGFFSLNCNTDRGVCVRSHIFPRPRIDEISSLLKNENKFQALVPERWFSLPPRFMSSLPLTKQPFDPRDPSRFLLC